MGASYYGGLVPTGNAGITKVVERRVGIVWLNRTIQALTT